MFRKFVALSAYAAAVYAAQGPGVAVSIT